MPNRERGDWWDRSLTLVSGCNWPDGETPDECRNCYAVPMCERFPAIRGLSPEHCAGAGKVPFSTVVTHPDRLTWLKPAGAARTWLCSIAGDLFHRDVPADFVLKVLDHIWLVNIDSDTIAPGRPMHRVALLTKRYRRAVELINLYICEKKRDEGEGIDGYVHDSWILMFSAGTQANVDRACAAAAKLPPGVRWGLHLEPLLKRVDLPVRSDGKWMCDMCCWGDRCDNPTHFHRTSCPYCDGSGTLPAPAWICVGGETNVRNRRAARPCHPDWVRGIRDQCQMAGVPFWFKSWGEWEWRKEIRRDGKLIFRGVFGCVGKKRAGRLLDGREWNEMPEGWEVNG